MRGYLYTYAGYRVAGVVDIRGVCVRSSYSGFGNALSGFVIDRQILYAYPHCLFQSETSPY